MTIDLTLPTSWQQLTQEQLRFVFTLLSLEYDSVRIRTLCIFKWTDMHVERVDGNIFTVTRNKQTFELIPLQVNAAIETLKWLDDIPLFPIRLEKIGRRKATRADFQDVTFENWIAIDNLFQGYLQTKRDDLLLQIARILYDSKSLEASKAELVGVFYWVTSVKQMFAGMFKHLFKAASGDASPSLPTYEKLRENMNTMIRSLTGGDITKEKEVLQQDCWRALTELDAKAKDYEDMKSKSHS